MASYTQFFFGCCCYSIDICILHSECFGFSLTQPFALNLFITTQAILERQFSYKFSMNLA